MLYQWIHHTGNHFENTKILIDTGALIPTGVAISEYFFTNTLRGRMEDLEPSELGSANGASSNSTMETIGQLEVRIRFNNLSTIFSGSAVVLKNLSLPVIIGVNFLKTNSLSPILDPSSAQIVHKPTDEKQDLIANLQNRSRPILRSPRKSIEKSPPPHPQNFAIDNQGAPVLLLKSKSFMTIPKKTTQAVEVHVPVNQSSLINVQPLDDEQLNGALPAVYRHKTQQKDKSLFIMYTNLSVTDSFPTPNISEILNSLGKSRYFSMLDASNAYHCIEVEES